MSKLTTFVVVLMLIGTISAQQSANKHRAVGIDTLLNNNIVLTKYINCLLDIGPCTNDGRELKKLLPTAIRGDCSGCTDAQRRNSKKVINFLRSRRPQDWKKLVDKYDPEGMFERKYNTGAIKF